ncbi:MAG: hypothetical protein ACI96M_004423, partial [Candidatus Azotimanducaceae bacterium]
MKKIAFGQTIGILQTEAGYKLLQSRIAIRNR